ncbi:hypothetical protein TRFO_13326 [Tritrichomonas foetus]|uniref:Uncharacterized protein n=1 Tax=Tritrichomonas foetus TaxID=1144522 RepID=A0A1J4L2Y4_9EUKA|nr:hypothetical protein TRFO_13326 [Tritrichomonas foetus]|eukprot:OHT16310.1 hypothetical protein TRFO_13326 [Tritrichomonas foetus]
MNDSKVIERSIELEDNESIQNLKDDLCKVQNEMRELSEMKTTYYEQSEVLHCLKYELKKLKENVINLNNAHISQQEKIRIISDQTTNLTNYIRDALIAIREDFEHLQTHVSDINIDSTLHCLKHEVKKHKEQIKNLTHSLFEGIQAIQHDIKVDSSPININQTESSNDINSNPKLIEELNLLKSEIENIKSFNNNLSADFSSIKYKLKTLPSSQQINAPSVEKSETLVEDSSSSQQFTSILNEINTLKINIQTINQEYHNFYQKIEAVNIEEVSRKVDNIFTDLNIVKYKVKKLDSQGSRLQKSMSDVYTLNEDTILSDRLNNFSSELEEIKTIIHKSKLESLTEDFNNYADQNNMNIKCLKYELKKLLGLKQLTKYHNSQNQETSNTNNYNISESNSEIISIKNSITKLQNDFQALRLELNVSSCGKQFDTASMSQLRIEVAEVKSSLQNIVNNITTQKEKDTQEKPITISVEPQFCDKHIKNAMKCLKHEMNAIKKFILVDHEQKMMTLQYSFDKLKRRSYQQQQRTLESLIIRVEQLEEKSLLHNGNTYLQEEADRSISLPIRTNDKESTLVTDGIDNNKTEITHKIINLNNKESFFAPKKVNTEIVQALHRIIHWRFVKRSPIAFIDNNQKIMIPIPVFPLFSTMIESQVFLPSKVDPQTFESFMTVLLSEFYDLKIKSNESQFICSWIIMKLVNSVGVEVYKFDSYRVGEFNHKFNSILNECASTVLKPKLSSFDMICNRLVSAAFERQTLISDFKFIFHALIESFKFPSSMSYGLEKVLLVLLDKKIANKLVYAPSRFKRANIQQWAQFIEEFEMEIPITKQIVSTLQNTQKIYQDDSLRAQICPNLDVHLVAFLLVKYQGNDEDDQQLIDQNVVEERFKAKVADDYGVVEIDSPEFSIKEDDNDIKLDAWSKGGIQKKLAKEFPYLLKYSTLKK